MKTLNALFLALILFTTSFIAKADEPSVKKLTKSYTVSSYINTMTTGEMLGFEAALDPSVTFSVLRGQKIVTYGRVEMLEFIKRNKGIVQQCVTTTSQVQANNDISVVKVDMKYENFTRSNYITMANTSEGWKITSVYSVFK